MAGEGYNPYRESDGKFASGPGGGPSAPAATSSGSGSGGFKKAPSWPKDKKYSPTSGDVKDHAARTRFHAHRAEFFAQKAASAKTESEAKKFKEKAVTSAKHALTCAKRAVKAAPGSAGAFRAKEHAAKAVAHVEKIKTGAKSEPKTIAKIEDAPVFKPSNATWASVTADPGFKSEVASVMKKETQVPATSSHTNGPISHLEHSEHVEYANKFNDKITGKQKKAISDYSGHHYAAINGGLRKPPPSAAVKKKVEQIDAALEKSAAPKDMIVYRGTNGKKFVENLKPGDVYQDKGFMSTSIQKSVAEGFGGEIMFNIHVPKGHPIAPIKGGQHDNEKEMLMPRGTSLKILSIEKIKTSWGSERLLVHAKVHTDE